MPISADSRAVALVGYGTATVHEALGRRAFASGIELLVGPAFAGPAITVAIPSGDNLGLHAALQDAPSGAVLCVASGGQGLFGVLGDLLQEAARTRGLAGIVVDDSIRDLAQLEAPPSLAARGVSARGTMKRRVLSLGRPVAIGGVLIHPGDWIVGDGDGICVVPAGQLDALLAGAEARTQRESGIRTKLKAGRTSVEVLGLAHLLEGDTA